MIEFGQNAKLCLLEGRDLKRKERWGEEGQRRRTHSERKRKTRRQREREAGNREGERKAGKKKTAGI